MRSSLTFLLTTANVLRTLAVVNSMITISQALERQLRDRGRSVVTEFQLFLLIRDLYAAKSFEGEPIAVRRDFPLVSDLRRVIGNLTRDSVLKADIDFPQCFRVIDAPDQSPEEICCEIDPFCYVSHLSAMQWHGLSERNPVELSLTTPHRVLWTEFASKQMSKIYSDDLDLEQTIHLYRIDFPLKVRRRTIRRHETRYPGDWRQVPGQEVRVASIGQTFLDMLTEPSWCGGMAHVIDIWMRDAEIYLDEIIFSIDKSPKKLAKVRAGYLLEERLNLKDIRIEQWRQFAQRGGSQKLDPEGPYSPPYSEGWMISINV